MKLRGALLGAGNIALRSHAPQWIAQEQLRDEVEIVAVADLSPSNLQRIREILPAARVYAGADELLSVEEIDFADICTPPFSHRGLIERAAGQGLHVVCEKPVTPTLDDTERVVEAVSRARIVFQPCHQYHFSPQWQAVCALLPRIGRVYFAEYDVQRTSANPGNPNWSPAWRTEASLAGGGILADHGAHIFYQLAAVLGAPQTVQATVRTLRHHGYEVEDTALVTLDYGDALAQVRLSWAARRRQIQFRFVGEAGEITGGDSGLRLHAEATEEIAFDKGMSQDSAHADWYGPLFTGFVERVRRGDCSLQPLEEAVAVSRITSRAYEASEAGRCLSLDGDLERRRPLEGAVESAALELPGVARTMAELGPRAAPLEQRGPGWALRGAGLAILVATLAWAFHDIHWGALGEAMSQARPGWLMLAAAVNLGVLLFQAMRWLALLRPLSKLVTLGQAFKAMIVGFAVSTVVPARAGELARVEWLGRVTGLSRISVLGSIVLDQLVNAAALLVGLAALPLIVKVPIWLRPGGYLALALFLVGVLLVTALRATPVVGEGAEASLAEGAQRRTWLRLSGVASFLARIRSGVVASRHPRALGASLGASFVAWGLEVEVTALSMRAVGLHLPLTASILVLIAVNLALAVPFAPPGNVGTLELGATLALMEFGVPKEPALAFALCYHLLQVVPIGILGFGLLSHRAAPAMRSASSR
jgi:uncharacterized protein (TIRG00374 family)